MEALQKMAAEVEAEVRLMKTVVVEVAVLRMSAQKVVVEAHS